MILPLRPVLVGTMLALAAAVSALAQRVEYTANNNAVSLIGPVPDVFLSLGEEVYVTFVFDLTTPPISVSTTAAVYPGIYGVGELGSGEVRLLYNVTLTITRDPLQGDYSYGFSGVSADGWTFVHSAHGAHPSFVPDFSLPTTNYEWRPEPEFQVDAYVDVNGPNREWRALSDGGPWFNVALVPAPVGLPVITKQPASANVKLGRAVKFEAKVASATPVSYQWLRNELPIVGENAPRLSLKKITSGQAGTYRVLIGNDSGFVLSEPATLTID